jgi:hypothetical protein
MNWNHPRDRTTAEVKQNEPRTGTRWSYIAAAASIA